ncbi:hypothetical protein CN093_03925 [Sinorhizobium meliloti]|uniref:hypothetical protein n=1 Tax=Rhizobium meliloti TaxID=382 RepID=UPI000FD4441E|nr:hypothetical protein [Sinorhizobium meliloti]RVO43465.1 hypothetical protein CN093_03925 [Sinorhizobium meliloti]
MPKYESVWEQAVFESLVPKLQDEGFEVFIQPDRHLLPPFMNTYRPDAIALKPGKKLAIEVISDTWADSPKVRNLKALFQPHGDWELRVIFSPREGGAESSLVESTSARRIQETLDAVASIGEYAHGIPALLTLWGAFEATGRRLSPNEFSKPQTPGRLLEVLASRGYLTPDEADYIRDLVALRNKAIHGNLNVTVTVDQLRAFRTIVEALLKEAIEFPSEG